MSTHPPPTLREIQAPLKAAYKSDPSSALITLRASGTLDAGSGITCRLDGPNAKTIADAHRVVAREQKEKEKEEEKEHAHHAHHAHAHSGADKDEEEQSGSQPRIAGLHALAGGPPSSLSGELCSGDMLLDALVACSGVTLKAVCTALNIPLASGTVRAEGDLDFRGTLGVDRDAPVGFVEIRVLFDLAFERGREVGEEEVERLGKLTERYCVVLQTLKGGVRVRTRVEGRGEVEGGVERVVAWVGE